VTHQGDLLADGIDAQFGLGKIQGVGPILDIALQGQVKDNLSVVQTELVVLHMILEVDDSNGRVAVGVGVAVAAQGTVAVAAHGTVAVAAQGTVAPQKKTVAAEGDYPANRCEAGNLLDHGGTLDGRGTKLIWLAHKSQMAYHHAQGADHHTQMTNHHTQMTEHHTQMTEHHTQMTDHQAHVTDHHAHMTNHYTQMTTGAVARDWTAEEGPTLGSLLGYYPSVE